jgi:hypothetical protein
MGYSVPEGQSAPLFFLASYPQAYPQAGQGGWGSARLPRSPTPPVAEYGGQGLYTPQQKIFAKVKADLASDLRLYIL